MFTVVPQVAKYGDPVEPEIVYAVRKNSKAETSFLFYRRGHWVWRSADYYMPPE